MSAVSMQIHRVRAQQKPAGALAAAAAQSIATGRVATPSGGEQAMEAEVDNYLASQPDGADQVLDMGGESYTLFPPEPSPSLNQGYLELSYPPYIPREERQPVEYYQIMGAYHEAALDLDDLGVPDLPEAGVGRAGLFGPWQLYFNDWEHAAAFADKFAIVAMTNVDNEMVELKVDVKRCIEPSKNNMGWMPQDFIREIGRASCRERV